MDKPAAADARILAALEGGIPLEPRPFAALAGQLGMDEPALLDRVKALLRTGAVRRLAVSFDSRALGFAATLVAAKAKAGKDRDAIALVNSYDEVTHNYRRSGADLDIWFTLIAPDKGRIAAIISELAASGLFASVVELPTTRSFKVDVRFAERRAEAGK